MTSFASLKTAIFDREARKQQYQAHVRGLNAYDRHNKFVNDYVKFYGNEKSSNVKLPVRTDQDTLREGYRYCIADMSFYKTGKVNFSYSEAGENKQALVKLVACEKCAEKLHYRNRKEKEKLDKMEKEEQKRKRYTLL
ncbi:Protein FRA10AC1 [Linum grandiflorum]